MSQPQRKNQHPQSAKLQPNPITQPGPSTNRRKQQPPHKASRSPALPKDPEGKRYTLFFNHGFKPIYADPEEQGKKPEWFSKEQNYPLEPRILWKHFTDPEIFIGIRFGSQTRYLMIDLDSTSPYHPDHSPADFKKILDSLERLGFGIPVATRSSWSGGLHICYGFPEPLPTYKIALLAKKGLIDTGFQLRSGQLEIFPNPKAYSQNKISDYKAHALPLQAGRGSILLQIETWSTEAYVEPVRLFDGKEYNPHQLKQFNDLMEESAATCNLNKLNKNLEKAYQQRSKYQERYKNLTLSDKAAEWEDDLVHMISSGFGDFGQTNWLLHKIGVLGFVFLHKEGSELVNYMREQVTGAPGYKEYCRHQHQIEKRCAQWAKCISETGYYCKYRGFPVRQLMNFEKLTRQITKGTNKNPNSPPQQNKHNKEQASLATKKIISAIQQLQKHGEYPFGKAVRMRAIIDKTKELYGIGVSQRTLYRRENLQLWNPDYEITDPWEEELISTQPNPPRQTIAQELQKPAIAGLLPPAKNPIPVKIRHRPQNPYPEAFLTSPLPKLTICTWLEPLPRGISHLPNAYEGLLSTLLPWSPSTGSHGSSPSENLPESAFPPLWGINQPKAENCGLWSLVGVNQKTLGWKLKVNQLTTTPGLTSPYQPGQIIEIRRKRYTVLGFQGENNQHLIVMTDSGEKKLILWFEKCEPGNILVVGQTREHEREHLSTLPNPTVDEKAWQPGVTLWGYGRAWKLIEKVGASEHHLLVEDSEGQKQVFYDYIELVKGGLLKLIAPEEKEQQQEENQQSIPNIDSEQEFLEWYNKAVERGWIEKMRDPRHLPIVNYQGQQVRAVILVEKDHLGRVRKVIKPWLQVREKY